MEGYELIRNVDLYYEDIESELDSKDTELYNLILKTESEPNFKDTES